MNKNSDINIAQLCRELDQPVGKKFYHHLLILLEYVSLNEALTLLLSKESK